MYVRINVNCRCGQVAKKGRLEPCYQPLIDSNVLLDLMMRDARWLSWSAEAIERVAGSSRLVITPVIYAEVSGLSRV
jgi:hypothetical protein